MKHLGEYWEIILRNIRTPIVLAIFILALALLWVGEYRDAWFISVVILVNVTIAIIQEIRAKHALARLELLNAPRARRIDDGTDAVKEVPIGDLCVGDMILVQAGDEIPADAHLLSASSIEVDEGALTGEARGVVKDKDMAIYGGTTVLSGEAQARITALGHDTKVGKISKQLKRYKPKLTPLQRQIQRAITVLTFGAIGLAALIFIIYYFSGVDSVQILKTITSAAVTIVPEGLLLASSLLLAFGSLKLAQAKVLPQKLSAIEAMALLETLAVDKTGTLTSDTIELGDIESLSKKYSDTDIKAVTALVAKETSGGNVTGAALLDKLTVPKRYTLIDKMNFSSDRKMSGVQVEWKNAHHTYIMGAPEYVSAIAPLTAKQQKHIETMSAAGVRVLLLAEITLPRPSFDRIMDQHGRVMAIITLENRLREGVKDTVTFLQRRGVMLRVISGDNPLTVQAIAKQSGIHHTDKMMTGSELDGLSDDEWDKRVAETTIFARVLPEQKERLIATFRDSGQFTGMVGDGINDALALKKSDLGVAMYAGAPATRKVADIVLLDNSFTSLPIGMRLGNRIMQSVEVIATLFFHKIIYGVVLLLVTMALNMVYPFAPRHITFMNIFLVTMPTLMWTLFPPTPKHRVNPRRFWRDTLWAVAPIALITGLTVSFTYWIMSSVYDNYHPEDITTLTVIVATFFGVYAVFLVGRMFAVSLTKGARVARRLYLAAVCVVAVVSFGIPPLRDFFDFGSPRVLILWPAIGVIILAAWFQYHLATNAGKRFSEHSRHDQKLEL